LIKIIKNIIYLYLLGQVLYYGYMLYSKGYKFDASDSKNSLQIMIKMTNPLEREEFLTKFDNVCEGARCINLHGLTKDEIYEIFDKKNHSRRMKRGINE